LLLEKLYDQGIIEVSDLIIGIFSPSIAVKDLKEIFFLYRRAGVKEYWIITLPIEP